MVCVRWGYGLGCFWTVRNQTCFFNHCFFRYVYVYHYFPLHAVSSVFTVFDDFIHYSGGVYKHLEGGEVGSHAIEIIGWGVDKGENYW